MIDRYSVRMILLKPSGRLRRLTSCLPQVVNLLAKGGVGQNTLDFSPRDRLQDHPRVVGDLPQDPDQAVATLRR